MSDFYHKCRTHCSAFSSGSLDDVISSTSSYGNVHVWNEGELYVFVLCGEERWKEVSENYP